MHLNKLLCSALIVLTLEFELLIRQVCQHKSEQQVESDQGAQQNHVATALGIQYVNCQVYQNFSSNAASLGHEIQVPIGHLQQRELSAVS